MSGHSKWAQTKHKKSITDAKRAKIFSKLAALIAIAAREGGSDSDTNPKLRLAVEKARAVNMPQENIGRAIQRGAGAPSGEALEEMVLEGYGPTGAAILVQAVTDNRNRTINEIRSILQEHGGKLAESGSVRWHFKEVGVIQVPLSQWNDAAELRAIDLGAEEIRRRDETMEIVVRSSDLDAVRTKLEEGGLQIAEAQKEFKSTELLTIADPALRENLLALFEALDEQQDVKEIYSNAAL